MYKLKKDPRDTFRTQTFETENFCKNSQQPRPVKNCWRCHHFTQVYQKPQLYKV